MNLKTLDVGCGNNPTGDVNVDLFLNEHTFQGDSTSLKFIDAKKIRNPVKADAHFLPFKTNSFEEVYSSHVLEHLQSPTKALLEMIRVSREKVFFVVPHKFCKGHKKALRIGVHKHTFSSTSVIKWLTWLKLDFSAQTTFEGILNKFLPLAYLPSEIKVEIWKATN